MKELTARIDSDNRPPPVDSYVRLVTCYLVEYSEDWNSDRSYIKQEKIIAALEHGRELLAAQRAN